MSENVFADEWRACLRAHYMHVVRSGDHVTEPTLRVVMHSAGFSDDELAELRVRATLHVDDVGTDFVPDLDVLTPSPITERGTGTAAESPAEPAGEAVYSIATPVETDYPLPEAVMDDTPPADELPSDEAADGEPPPDDDAPQQLRLF